MNLEFDKTGGLIGTITGGELFRLSRGDRVEYGCLVMHADRLTLVCESPQSAQLLADLQFEMRMMERQNAILKLELVAASGWLDLLARAQWPSIPCDVICPTVGDSVARLAWLLYGMRSGDGGAARIIVADDAGGGFEHDKQTVARLTGCEYVKNTGKPGIPGNLNSALAQCRADWILVVDDGSSVHFDWLKSATEIVDAVSGRTFGGRKVAMIGSSHLQDWQLRLAGRLDRWTITEWFYRPPEICDAMQRHFREKIHCPHNLDWGTVAALWEAGPKERNDEWPTEVKDFLRYNVEQEPILADDVETEVCRAKYLWRDRWAPGQPATLRVNWSPGAQGLLINREFLAECGGFSRDCVAYEQWLACQAAERGYLSLHANCAPYIHMPSLGFTELGVQKIEPVHRDIYDVCREVFGEPDPRKVIRKFVSPDDEANANAELMEASCEK